MIVVAVVWFQSSENRPSPGDESPTRHANPDDERRSYWLGQEERLKQEKNSKSGPDKVAVLCRLGHVQWLHLHKYNAGIQNFRAALSKENASMGMDSCNGLDEIFSNRGELALYFRYRVNRARRHRDRGGARVV